MPALTDLDLPLLSAELQRFGCVPSHARNLLRNFYDHHGRIEFAELKVGKRVEELLSGALPQRQSAVTARSVSADGTTKLLIGFAGGGAVESVLMPGYRADRAAGCVSSQIGCAMGCDFAPAPNADWNETSPAGKSSSSFCIRAEAAGLGRRLMSLVFMGMGEPLLNLANVLQAIDQITSPQMGSLGGRHVTVSTVGIVPGIHALADADRNVHLALSLHAPDDATRAKLVPMNRRYPVAEILSAARDFQNRSGRIVTIEYCMLAGVNDTDFHAHLLADLLADFHAHVNLIPYNPIGAGLTGVAYQRPDRQRILDFLTILRDAGVVTHARDTRGDDVNAACGQLRETSFETA